MLVNSEKFSDTVTVERTQEIDTPNIPSIAQSGALATSRENSAESAEKLNNLNVSLKI